MFSAVCLSPALHSLKPAQVYLVYLSVAYRIYSFRTHQTLSNFSIEFNLLNWQQTSTIAGVVVASVDCSIMLYFTQFLQHTIAVLLHPRSSCSDAVAAEGQTWWQSKLYLTLWFTYVWQAKIWQPYRCPMHAVRWALHHYSLDRSTKAMSVCGAKCTMEVYRCRNKVKRNWNLHK